MDAFSSTAPNDTVTKFLRLIVRLSPSTDSTFESHRLWIGFSSDTHGPLAGAPYVDYLSYIRVFRLSSRPYNMELIQTMEDIQSLILGVCGHQLSNLRAISIPCNFLDAWTAHIPDLVSINTIEFLLDWVPYYHPLIHKVVPTSVETQIQAAMAFTKTFLEARKKAGISRGLDVQLFLKAGSGNSWLREVAWKTPAQELYALGRSVRMLSFKDDNVPDGFRLWVNPPGKLDLTRLHTFHLSESFKQVCLADILQQSPSLSVLKFHVVPDYNLDAFRWAAEDRRRRLATPPDDGNSHLPPVHEPVMIPPVQSLELRLEQYINDLSDFLQDAAMAFGPTLKTFHVIADMFHDYHRFPSFSDLPLLSTFKTVGNIGFSPSTLAKCPNLTTLHIERYVYADERDPNAPVDTWVLAKTITTLQLIGTPAFYFTQASFTFFADCLEHLELGLGKLAPSRWGKQFSWDESRWVFPRLRTLKLEGVFARMFRISMLVQSPLIEELVLTFSSHLDSFDFIPLSQCFFDLNTTTEESRMDDDSSSGASEQDHKSTGSGPCRAFPSLCTLDLTRCVASDEVLEHVLPSLFPRLRRLVLTLCTTDRKWSENQFWDTYPKLTTLRRDEQESYYYDDPVYEDDV
ncbi:hypothetical protein BGZ73_006471 [Actinomortierella ambigua]|nr:hypothetical protein BGZ73_006471 [Actinomortierella ambigua]